MVRMPKARTFATSWCSINSDLGAAASICFYLNDDAIHGVSFAMRDFDLRFPNSLSDETIHLPGTAWVLLSGKV